LTDTSGYDAEATVSPKGDKIVFTSMRSGDLELYTMNIDGSNVKQITNKLGYDGGAFFSPTELIWFSASRPKTQEEIKNLQGPAERRLVMPTDMELYTCKADGSEQKQITSWAEPTGRPFILTAARRSSFQATTKAKGFISTSG
jgi:hypothetical protein